MVNIAVLGTGATARACAEVLRQDHNVSLIVSMPAAERPDNSVDMAAYAAEIGAKYGEIDLNRRGELDAILDLFAEYPPDVIFSMWPQMLPKEVIDAARIVTIGSHCGALPQNRGRHPLHWSIVLGIEEGVMSFFRMDEKADHGPILLQVPFQVGKDINEANAAMEAAAVKGAGMLAEQLRWQMRFDGIEQDHAKAGYWRKRTPYDCLIDPRMTGDAIVRLVASFCPPYPCAKLVVGTSVIPIRTATASLAILDEDRVEHGRILAVTPSAVSFKVEGGIVTLDADGDIDLVERLGWTRHIHPPARYIADFPGIVADIER